MPSNDGDKIVKFRKKINPAAAIIILIIVGYILYLVFSAFTEEHVSVYEVVKKDVSDNDTLRGIILRNEKLVSTELSGYLNFYLSEGEKVGVNSVVYSVDEDGSVFQAINENISDAKLDKTVVRDIRYDISSFVEGYTKSDFNTIYDFKYRLSNTAEQLSIQAASKKINKLINKNSKNSSFQVVKSDKTGIISYLSDGLEDLNLKNLTPDNFKNMTDSWKVLKSTDYIEEGSPAYKLVTSDKWSIVCKISEEQFEELNNEDSISITIKNDNIKIYPYNTVTFKMDDESYACFYLSDYMVQYIDDRFIDIQINLNSAEGLKIPVSSICSKEVYRVPSDIISVDENGSNCVSAVGITTDKKGNVETNKVSKVLIEIYKYDSETDTYLVDGEGLSRLVTVGGYDSSNPGSISGTTFVLDDPIKVKGVYNCNYGYCKFNMIDIIYENPEYIIVRGDNSYGLSLYDHIVLNADKLKEGELIY